MRSLTLLAFGCIATLGPMNALAAYCMGGSRMACYEGVDASGRSPGALYDAAVEGLREAQTPAQRDLARRAMKDALNPAMSDQRAILCNQADGDPVKFQQCVKGPGPARDMKMTVPCQQNTGDGRVLLDSRFVPAGAHYNIQHYHPQSVDGNGWTHGECDIAVAAKSAQ